jgi:hypothetical protein
MNKVLLKGLSVVVPCQDCDKCPEVALSNKGDFVTIRDDFGGAVRIPREQFLSIQKIKLEE